MPLPAVESQSVPAAGVRAARRARWATTALFGVNGAASGSWFPHIPEVQARAHLSPGILGVALLGMGVGALLGMPLAGALTARRGTAVAAGGGGVVTALLLPLPVAAPSALVLGVALALFGAALAAMDVAMNAHGLEVEARLRRPILSSLHGAWSLGALVGAGGAALAGALGATGERHAVPVAVLLALVAAVCMSGLLPPAARGTARGPGLVRPARAVVLLGALALCSFAAEGAISDWSALHLVRELGTSTAVGAVGYAAFALTMVAGRLVGDRLRLRLAPVLLVRLGALLAGVGLLLVVVVPSVPVAVLGFALVGLGLANVVPLVFAWSGRVPGLAAGIGIAGAGTMGYLGALAGPPLIGLVAEAVGIRQSFLVPLALCLAIVAGAAAGGRTVGDR